MSDLVSTEDPVMRFAKLHAAQYYLLAKEIGAAVCMFILSPSENALPQS